MLLAKRERYARLTGMSDKTIQQGYRLLPTLVDDIKEYARQRGISINAAVALLLREGLHAEDKRSADRAAHKITGNRSGAWAR